MSQYQIMQERIAARHQRREERQRQRERDKRSSQQQQQQQLTEKNNESLSSNGSNGNSRSIDPFGASLNSINTSGSGSTLSSQQQKLVIKKSSSARDLHASSEEVISNNAYLMDAAKLSLRGSTITPAHLHSNFLETVQHHNNGNSPGGMDASSMAHAAATGRRDSASSAFALRPPSKDTRTYNASSLTGPALAPPSKDSRPYGAETAPALPIPKPLKSRKSSTDKKHMSSSSSTSDSIRRGSLNGSSTNNATDTPSRPSSTTRGGREPRRGNIQRHRSRSLTDLRVERTNSGNQVTRLERNNSGNQGNRLEATPKTPRATMKRGATAGAKLGEGKMGVRNHNKMTASYSAGMVVPSSPEEGSNNKIIPPATPTRRKSGRNSMNRSSNSVIAGDPSPGAGRSSPRSAKRMSSASKKLSSSDRQHSHEESPASRRSLSSTRRRSSHQQPKLPRSETPQSARGNRSHRSSNNGGGGYKMPPNLLAKDDQDALLASPTTEAVEATSRAFALAKDALAKKEALAKSKKEVMDGSGSSNNSGDKTGLGGSDRKARGDGDESSSSGDEDVLFTPQRTPKAAKPAPNKFDSPDAGRQPEVDKSKLDVLQAPRSVESRRRRHATSTDDPSSGIPVGSLPLTSQSMHQQTKQNNKSLSALTAAVVEKETVAAAAGWSMANPTLVNKWKSKLASSSASVASGTTTVGSVSVGTGVSSCNLSALNNVAGPRKSLTPPRSRRSNSIGEVDRSDSFEANKDDEKKWFGDSSSSESAPAFEDDDDDDNEKDVLHNMTREEIIENLNSGTPNVGKINKRRPTGNKIKDVTTPRRLSKGMDDSLRESILGMLASPTASSSVNEPEMERDMSARRTSKGMDDSLKESILGILAGSTGNDEPEKVRGRRMRDDNLQHSEHVSREVSQKRGASNPRSGSRARKPPGTRRSSGRGQLSRTRSRSLSDLQSATRKGRRRASSKTPEMAEEKKKAIRKMHSSTSRMDLKKKRSSGKQLMGDSHSTFSTINTTKSDNSKGKERSSVRKSTPDESGVPPRRSTSKPHKQLSKPSDRRRGVPRTRSRSLTDLRVPRRDRATKNPQKLGSEEVKLSLKDTSTKPAVVSRHSSETVRKPAVATRQSNASVSKLNKTPDQMFDQSSNTLSTQESNNSNSNSNSNSNRMKWKRVTRSSDGGDQEEESPTANCKIRRSKTEDLGISNRKSKSNRNLDESEAPKRPKNRRFSTEGLRGGKTAASESHTVKALRVLEDEREMVRLKAQIRNLEKDFADIEHRNKTSVAMNGKRDIETRQPETILNDGLVALVTSQEDIIDFYTKENEREYAYQKALKENMFDLYQETSKLAANVDQTQEYVLELEDIHGAEVMKNEALQKNIPVFQKVIEAHENKLQRRTRYIAFERETTLYYRGRMRAIVRNFQERCTDDNMLVETLENMVLGTQMTDQHSSSSSEATEKD